MKRIIAITTLLIIALGSIVSHADASTLRGKGDELSDNQSLLYFIGEDNHGYHFIDISFVDDNLVFIPFDDSNESYFLQRNKLWTGKVFIGTYENKDKWHLVGIKEYKIKK